MENSNAREQFKQFFEIWSSMEKLYDRYAKSMGLTTPALTVLEIIYETPENCTQKLICEETHYPKQSVNLIIKTFLEQGYIEMKEIDSDRRNKKIRLTKSGQAYSDNIMAKLTDVENATVEQLTAEERDTLIEIMKKIEMDFRDKVEMCIDSPKRCSP